MEDFDKLIASYLIETYPVTRKHGGTLLIDGNSIKTPSDLMAFFFDVTFPEKLDQPTKIKGGIERIFNLVHTFLSEAKEKKEEKSLTIPKVDCTTLKLERYSVMMASDGNEYVFDHVTKRVTNDLHPKAYWSNFTQKDKDLIREETGIIYAAYNPYDNRSIFPKILNGKEVPALNLCTLPDWFYNESPPKITEIPPHINKLLKILTGGSQKEIDKILSWTREMLFKKPQSALFLIGVKGLGKNLFIEILRALVGLQNFVKGPNSLFRKEFNTVLLNKRLVFMDEVSLRTHNEIDRFKEYQNDYITPEGKGKDAVDFQPIFASFILTQNDPTKIYLERDDRRYLIPDLGDKPLRYWLPDENKMSRFCEMITSLSSATEKRLYDYMIKEVEDFFYFLRGYSPTISLSSPPRGKRFNEMVLASLAPWKITLREKILNATQNVFITNTMWGDGARTTYDDRGTRPQGEASIAFWLDNWEEEDGSRLGTLMYEVTDTGKKPYIEITKEKK